MDYDSVEEEQQRAERLKGKVITLFCALYLRSYSYLPLYIQFLAQVTCLHLKTWKLTEQCINTRDEEVNSSFIP